MMSLMKIILETVVPVGEIVIKYYITKTKLNDVTTIY